MPGRTGRPGIPRPTPPQGADESPRYADVSHLAGVTGVRSPTPRGPLAARAGLLGEPAQHLPTQGLSCRGGP